jgi:hypothetical protein
MRIILLVLLLAGCSSITIIDLQRKIDAKLDTETSKDDGSGSPQPDVRKEGRDTNQSRERVQPRR